jgi:hypothetical protein
MAPASMAPVFVVAHARILPAGLQISIKTADPALTAAFAGAIAARLRK